jgi:hypothetical protein
MATATGDFAIVIGIDRYPDLQPVPGAAADASSFAAWLIASGVPKANITLLVSTDREVKKADIEKVFDDLAVSALDVKIGRRLYLYLTGAGATVPEDTVFLPSDATKKMHRGFQIRAYANYFARAGVFEEVVLFADIHLSDFRGTQAIAPPYVPLTGELPSAKFYLMAGSPRGQLTRLVLDGLSGGAAENGFVTSATLADYVAKHWSREGPDSQEPTIDWSPGKPIVFDVPPQVVRESPAAEHVGTHADDPALLDQLGRRPFAEVLGQRLDEFHRGSGRRDDAGAFMINLHGPWGAGKTSVLNLLRTYLQDAERAREDRWVVVQFNAWRQQRLRPPWWVLIKEVYRQSAASWRQIGIRRSLWLRVQWLGWRIRADWMPAVAATALIALVVLLATGTFDFVPQPPEGGVQSEPAAKSVELALKIIVAIAAAWAAVVTFTRSLAFGSPRAAQTYAELRSDPLGPIVVLFERLVRALRNPVVIFIDDVDRCETAYVVELLEGIQTLFRSAPVAYVIAADRKWIVTSFERTYEHFSNTLGEPGRPLGYLFLEKVFQVSAALPLLSPEIQRTYWSRLLRGGGAATPDHERKEHEQAALQSVRGLRTKEELDAKIEEVKGDAVREPAMRAAAAKQITSAEAQAAIKHRLEPCAELLESNPRAMKRLVNAFGFHQAAHFLEGRSVSPDALARWTIMELRWPLLSDYVAAHPSMIAAVGDGKAAGVPRDLKTLFMDADVQKVVAGGSQSIAPLDVAAVRAIVGYESPQSTS